MDSSTARPGSSAGVSVAQKPRSRKPAGLWIGGTAAVLILGVVLIVWTTRRNTPPRLNADTATLAKFVSSPRYVQLPFERQKQYMKILEDREDNDELHAAFTQMRLTEEEYRTAKTEAWLGEQLKRTENYMELGPGPGRIEYLTSLVNRKLENQAAEAARKRRATEDDEEDIKRDDTVERIRIASWPAEVRINWREFRMAYKEVKAARESEAAARQAKP